MAGEINELRCLVWADQKLKKKKAKAKHRETLMVNDISNLCNGKPPT